MIYCFIVLCEYFILSYFFYWAYSIGIALPTENQVSSSDEKRLSVQEINGEEDAIPDDSEQVDISFMEYLTRVFTLTAVWDNLDPENILKQPLTSSDGQSDFLSEA